MAKNQANTAIQAQPANEKFYVYVNEYANITKYKKLCEPNEDLVYYCGGYWLLPDRLALIARESGNFLEISASELKIAAQSVDIEAALKDPVYVEYAEKYLNVKINGKV